MFGDLSMGHIMIIAVIALIVLGPEKFPEYAKIALRAYRDFRGYVDGIKRDMADELHPIRRELNQLSRYNPEDYIEKLTEAVSSAGNSDKPKTEETAVAAQPESTMADEPTGETAGTTGEAAEPTGEAAHPEPSEAEPVVASTPEAVPVAETEPAAAVPVEEPPVPQTPDTVGDFEMYSAKGYDQPGEEKKPAPSSEA